MTINRNAKLEDDNKGTEVLNIDPLIIKMNYDIEYYHSYGQDSEFFKNLGKGKLTGSRCKRCKYTYATPRKHCMFCGEETEWIDLPLEGRIHSYTTCYFGSEQIQWKPPYHLILVEFKDVNSLFFSRLIGADFEDIYIGMEVRAKFRKMMKMNITDVYFVPK